MDKCDIAWAAGLFEGEGSVTLMEDGKHGRLKARVHLHSTDGDVIRRFAEVLGIGNLHGPYARRQEHHKPIYQWEAGGWAAVHTLRCLFDPYLGSRRKARFDEILAQEQAPVRRKPGEAHCMKGHELTEDNVRLTGNGRKCRQCERDYQAIWRAANPNYQREWRARKQATSTP